MANPTQSSKRAPGHGMSIGRRLFYTHLLVALIVAFALGAYLHWAAEQELRQALELRLVDNARLAAKSLDRIDIDPATGEANWQAAVSSLTEGNPGIRRVVLLAGSGDVRIVLADSAGPGSPLDLQTLGRPEGPVVLREQAAGFNAAAPLTAGERMVALSVATDDIHGKLSKLRIDSAISFVIAVVLALAMSAWLAQSARGVLRRFSARFADIAEGRLDSRLELRSDDEFTELARALNDMSERLAQSRSERDKTASELATAHERLQTMVRERTAELEQLNIEHRDEIERRCQLEAALAEAAATDAMTGLLNRRGMSVALEHAVAQARRQGRKLAVVVCDIDHFKMVNDQYGHGVGDQAIVALAKRLKSDLGPHEVAGRWGGEEFLLLWPGIDLPEAERRCYDLREELTSRPLLAGGPAITVSFGLAAHAPTETADHCVLRADRALYRAKDAGRNRVCVAP
jgi:diguanylate cyclase (GGDEF)-like protein